MDKSILHTPHGLKDYSVTVRHCDHVETFEIKDMPSWQEAKKTAIELWSEARLPWSNKRHVSISGHIIEKTA